MISVVVSSYNDVLFENLRKNIEQTIGVPYEIVRIENPGQMGICEAYNKGAAQAGYDIVCFAHEDIELLTHGWGSKIVQLFDLNPKLGLLGIAGSAYKTLAPSGWVVTNGEHLNYYNLLQGYKNTQISEKELIINPTGDQLAKVVCVDGVWMCTKKQIALSNPFDQTILKGFHCYDIDFSLSLYGKYEVCVTYDILLRHFSEGGFYSKDWAEATLKLYHKRKGVAPFSIIQQDQKSAQLLELSAFHSFVRCLKQLDYSVQSIVQLLLNSRVFHAVGLKGMLSLFWIAVKKTSHS